MAEDRERIGATKFRDFPDGGRMGNISYVHPIRFCGSPAYSIFPSSERRKHLEKVHRLLKRRGLLQARGQQQSPLNERTRKY